MTKSTIKSFADYHRAALLTLAPELPGGTHIEHVAYGLFEEVGELVGAFKRHNFYGLDLDMVNVREEMGDVLWYLAAGYEQFDLISPEWEVNNKVERLEQYSITDALRLCTRNSSNCFQFISLGHLDEIPMDLDRIRLGLEVLAYIYDLDLLDVARDNLIKLSKRHGETFKKAGVIIKDVEHELSHMVES